MKILIPILGFGKAGGYRVLSKMADELIVNGCDVTFIVPESHSVPYYPTKASIVKSNSPKNSNRYIRHFVKLYNLFLTVRKMGPGVVIANQHLTAYVALLLPSKFNKFYYIQANEIKLVKGILTKVFAYITYLFPLKKIVNASNLLPRHLNNYIGVIPAGVDLELFSTMPDSKLPLSDEWVRIGFIGRKEAYKGSAEIIKALEILYKEIGQKMQVNIAVCLPDIPVSLKNAVTFYDIKSDADLARFYHESDVIIATGLIEYGAFHYPCAEGMACAKLVISNYAPLVNTTSKLILEETTIEKLYSKIKFAITMSQNEIQQEIEMNLKLINEYSWDIVGHSMFKKLKIKN